MWKYIRRKEFSLYDGISQQRQLFFLKGVWSLLYCFLVEMEMFYCGGRLAAWNAYQKPSGDPLL